MARKRDEGRPRPRCELTTSKRKRTAARKLTAAIEHNFPPGLAQPALRSLARAGYTRLDDLAKVKGTDLAKLHGMGPKAISIIREALNDKGRVV
jgi:hypothetical protein